ncbi:MAG: phosphoglucosamine mutase [Planctomycetota bacterium]
MSERRAGRAAERLFGTDGIRGRYGEGWLTTDTVSALGRAIGEVVREMVAAAAGPRRALVGHDGRRSGPPLETAIARGLARAGCQVTSAGLITTPGLALLGRRHGFDVTAMISASHNPAADNGIKVFGRSGDKLADEVEQEIEERLRADPNPVAAGPAPVRDPALEDEYLATLLAAAGDLALDGRRIALDAANGGGSRVAPRVLGRLGAQVIPIGCTPDGDNINEGCGSTSPSALQAEVVASSAQLGIALDGDGDRCILVDETGALVHGDPTMVMLASHAKTRGALRGDKIVATVMSNRGLHRALRAFGVGVVTVGVGDRRVVEALRRDELSLGGEQSGHIVFGADNHYIGDGIYTALRALRVLRDRGVELSELAAPYEPFPQVLVNVPVVRKPDLAGLPAVAQAVARIEGDLGEDGRVLLRYSGTEPLARVMVEGPDEEWIRARARELAALIASQIGG